MVEEKIRKKKCDLINYLYDIFEDSGKRRIVKDNVITILMNGRDKVAETMDDINNKPISYIVI